MEETTYICERCGRVISYSDAYYEDDDEDDEDEPLCYDCLQARLQQATIHDYSYTPRLIFHGERDNKRFFGVELEIDGNGKSRTLNGVCSRTKLVKQNKRAVGFFFDYRNDIYHLSGERR